MIRKDTVEIRIQGGITAAKGIHAVFRVNAVMAVSPVQRPKKERERASDYRYKANEKKAAFSDIMQAAAQEISTAPSQYYTIVYGPNQKLTSTYYQTREYHY